MLRKSIYAPCMENTSNPRLLRSDFARLYMSGWFDHFKLYSQVCAHGPDEHVNMFEHDHLWKVPECSVPERIREVQRLHGVACKVRTSQTCVTSHQTLHFPQPSPSQLTVVPCTWAWPQEKQWAPSGGWYTTCHPSLIQQEHWHRPSMKCCICPLSKLR